MSLLGTASESKSTKCPSDIDENSESFLYRHVKSSEAKRTGPWTDDEKSLFLKELSKFKVDGTNWGVFSTKIKGRCGYQCKHFYETLVDSGEIAQIQISKPKWSPRMSEPWTTLTIDSGPNTIIQFPEDHHEPANPAHFEYQASRIMRLNMNNPLNFLLFSFPAAGNKRSEVINVIRNKLSHNINQSEVDALVHDYFALTMAK